MAKVTKAEVVTDAANGTVTWKWTDGMTTVINPGNDYPKPIVSYAVLHGLKQRLSDCYATITGVGDARAKFMEVHNSLKSGEWDMRGGPGEPRVTELAEAMSIVLDRTIDEVNAFLETSSAEEKKSYRETPEVSVAIAQIKERKAREQLAAAKKSQKESKPSVDLVEQLKKKMGEKVAIAK